MTIRAIICGLALGLFVSAFTHFNDMFIQGSWFISNHLPISVLGLLVLLMFTLNPLLRAIGPGWTLSGAELAVIVALGLAACGWPSFSYFRTFITITAMPNHWQGPQANWHAAGVMRYLPGGDPQLAEGHVQDWPGLTAALADPQRRQEQPVLERMWAQLQPNERGLIEHHAGEPVPIESRQRLLRVVNEALVSGDLTPQPPPEVAALPAPMRDLLQARRDAPLSERDQIRLNRWWLTVTLPDAVLPPPRGGGLLLAGGRADTPALEQVLVGSDTPMRLTQLPWGVWWPTLRLWGAAGLLLAMASLCLTLIVHPQWSRRELLPYPIARFVNELIARKETAWLPDITRQQTFWFGVGAMALVHGINGLNIWFPEVPAIPLRLDFQPMKELAPTFSRVWGTNELFYPYLYFSVIAFCFFLTTPVSFSLGIAAVVYGLLGAMLLTAGVSFQTEYMGAAKSNMLRFGAYLGMAGIIAYIGRRYYLSVLVSAFGTRRTADVSTSAVWAMRGLIVVFVLAVLVFRSAGLDWLMASLFVLLVLLIFLVATRIVVETGTFFVQVYWLPVGVLTGLLGFEALGPTTYLVLAIASVLLVGDPRTLLMPYLANGLQMVERSGATKPGRLAPWLIVMLLAGFLVSGAALFSLTYNHGHGAAIDWDVRTLPNMPFDQATLQITHSAVQDTLASATAVGGLGRLAAMQFSPAVWGWMGLGLLLLVGTAAARLRLPWWPIHPVLFLVWGTMPASRLAVSFLIGWAIKLAVVQCAGSRGYRHVLPLMIGVIAGELLMGLFWTGVSGSYYTITGLAPPTYRIYP
ncbi:DUF6785 family protein [Phycisphaerales bacterium AB-hyl4]|uniref:DUF6785 family protein n=1 Tax=Natronomicrosphaera hydrolytica TaxID=3242702 RepID=A0ABV4U7F5_9BACT